MVSMNLYNLKKKKVEIIEILYEMRCCFNSSSLIISALKELLLCADRYSSIRECQKWDCLPWSLGYEHRCKFMAGLDKDVKV